MKRERGVERKAGGWLTITDALGPLRRMRVVAWRDRNLLHSWSWHIGPFSIDKGYPRAPVEIHIDANYGRASLFVGLRVTERRALTISLAEGRRYDQT